MRKQREGSLGGRARNTLDLLTGSDLECVYGAPKGCLLCHHSKTWLIDA